MAATKDHTVPGYDTVAQYSAINPNYPFLGTPGNGSEIHLGSLPDMARCSSYDGLSGKMSDGTMSLINIDFGMPDEFDENSRKETEILNMNRVKLTEYVHDCSVLHPYMKEKKIFNVADCQLIQHQVTGAQRMDKFVDIVLTKGPKAIGVFHEALKKPYPYVFDMLTRLFTAAGVELPESRKINDDFDGSEDMPSGFNASITSTSSAMTSSSSIKGRTTTLRHTIRKRIDELTERCEVVKNQRDELQKALLQREKDINALMNHRDRVIQQKYEDMLSLLANWREMVTHQSDGNIQKMQELLSEHEGIRQDYETLEGDYMLVVSELSAARDRISKLLTHLQKMETENALAQEEKEALSDKLLAMQGEIQRLHRKFDRRPRGDNVNPGRRPSPADPDLRLLPHNCECKSLEEKLAEFEEKMKVCQKERRDALEERDKLQLKLHEEKTKRKKAKENFRKAAATPHLRHSLSEPPGDLMSLLIEDQSKNQPLVEETVVMPAMPVNESGMKIGLAIVVRELTDSGHALLNGVRVGDEIYQVNHIKLNSDQDPLHFAERLLHSASQTVTLSIKRQACLTTPPQTKPHTPLMGSRSYTPGGTLESLYSIIPSLSGATSPLPSHRARPHNLLPHFSNPSSSTSNSGRSHDMRDTSEDFSEDDSDGNYVFSEPEYMSESAHSGLITSPSRKISRDARKGILATMLSDPSGLKFSLDESQRSKGTLTGHVFPDPRDLTPDDRYSSLSPVDPPPSLEPQHLGLNDSPIKRARVIYNKRKNKGKSIRRRRPESENVRLSRSVDDIDLMWPHAESPDELQANREDGSRRVIMSSGHLGAGLSILGGRGNGLYIKSERNSSRSLRTGDRILQICRKSALKMTYAEALELLDVYTIKGKQCLLQVKYDREGYDKLQTSSRDNFYVKAKKSHKSCSRQELYFEEGDIFHVTDTKPVSTTVDMTNMWQVEKLDSRGHIISTGCIPICLENDDCPSVSGYHSLPIFQSKNPHPKKNMNQCAVLTLQSSKKHITAESAFKFYRPVNKIVVTEPRPVVLMGVFDVELGECLVERGSKGNVKFAFPSREPIEKMAEVEEIKIIESISVPDGIMQSTVDDIMEVTRNGNHCVLRLTTTCLAKPKVSSLRPIIITLSPHSKTIRVKPSGGRIPPCFTKEVLGQESMSAVKDKIKHVHKVMMASSSTVGDVEVSSAINLDELVTEIHDKVVELQRAVFWEMDV